MTARRQAVVVSFSGIDGAGKSTQIEMLRTSLAEAGLTSSLLTFDQILQKGFDGENFLQGLSDHFRELLVAKDEVTHVLLDFSENIRRKRASN